jgi:diguanylate cyclase (GGDEF)-like protein
VTEIATRDNVTLGWNRAAILKFLADEIDRGGRRKRPTGAILIDVDFFKMINDTYGHLAGDKALQALTAGLEANVRSYDKVGRYGGDEILVVLPDCDQVQVGRVAERIRQAAAKLRVRAGKKTLRLTLSMGCASTQGQARPSVDGLIRAADRALYMAKDAGRDRFVCAPPRSSVKTAKGMSHGRKKK